MNIEIGDSSNLNLDPIKLHKMVLVYNALEDGWSIKKKNNLYVFSKNHEGKKEVYLDDYLKRFFKRNFDLNDLLNE